jgi:hypothetical protein
MIPNGSLPTLFRLEKKLSQRKMAKGTCQTTAAAGNCADFNNVFRAFACYRVIGLLVSFM